MRGYILIGSIDRGGIYTSLIRNQTPLETVDFEMLAENASFIAFPKKPVGKTSEVRYNMLINVDSLDHRQINDVLRDSGAEVQLSGCIGQRFIAAGMKDKHIVIDGVPGNALGAYLDGAVIEVHASAQDAVGDTMNDGRIIIHGSIGDAAGYAMRGGKIFVRGDAEYRDGIHMKEYRDKIPVMIIGGSAGSFLAEYQAGGIIIVLGLNRQRSIVGRFPCTGMHGGKVFCGALPTGSIFRKTSV